MSTTLAIGSYRIGTRTVLGVLLGLALLAALLTPERAQDGDGLGSNSVGPGGARIAFELAATMGWKASRRIVPFDSVPAAPTVQAVIGPRQALGAREVHRLLENVRRGGGLLFTVDDGAEIADSLGMSLRSRGDLLLGARDNACPRRRTFAERRAAALPPTVHQIVWRRPPPGPVVSLATGYSLRVASANVAIGFPMGAGRVAAVSSSEVFANDALRTCDWGADITVARAFEYLASYSRPALPIVFDEYHHGEGVHPGSVGAILDYLSGTGSGRFFATLLFAGLVLVLAAAPRPVIPREPTLIARRSPLEHADALGQAYADVDATHTAASRLISGVRRRAGRLVPVPAAASETAFLDGVVRREPGLVSHVAIVKRGLSERMPAKELAAIGEALAEIERVLLTNSYITR